MTDIHPNSIIPTISPLAYFHSALKSLSLYPQLINRLLDLRYLESHNLIIVWINIGGEWREIKIDCWFPTVELTDPQNPTKVFKKWIMSEPSRNSGEIWPMVLQKAYAKAHGGFHRILMGKISHVLRDLTGGPVSQYDLTSVIKGLGGDYELARDKVWIKIKEAVDKENIVNAKYKLSIPGNRRQYYSTVVKTLEFRETGQGIIRLIMVSLPIIND